MYWLIGIIITLFIFLAILLCLPVKVSGTFRYLDNTPSYMLFAGLGPVKIDVKKLMNRPKKNEVPKKEEIKEKKKLSFKDIENYLNQGVECLGYLKKRFTVSLFSLKARFSLGDAAETGIATGAAYGSVYGILGAVDRYFILKKHEVVITPDFGGAGLETETCGEFQLRLIWCLGLIMKIRKGDVK